MKEFKWVVIALALIMTIMPPGRKAEAKEEQVIKMDEIVVTATKTEKSVTEAPGSISIITKAEIKRRNLETVDKMLAELPGVFVKRTKGLMDSTASVRMRGFKGDQYTLVLLDGQPLNDAYTGGLEWGMLPADNIERIEIIRGAASALYGGNAMGGVINIITKTPDRLECNASAGYGSHDTFRYQAGFGHRLWDKLSLRIGYEEETTDGYKTTPVVRTISSGDGNVVGGSPMNDKYGQATRWVVGDKGENQAEKYNINGKSTFDFSATGKISFTAVYGHHEYDYGAPNTDMGTFGDAYAIAGVGQRARFRPNDFIGYTGIGENETGIYTLAFQELFGPVQINAQVGTVRVDDRYTLESGSGMADYYNSNGSLKITENESWIAELRGDLPLGDAHLLTMGVSYRTNKSDTDDYTIPFYRSFSGKGESTFYSGGRDRNWAVFAQDEWQIIEPLTLYVGARFDSWKVYDGASGAPGAEISYKSNRESEFSPKVAAVWKVLPNTTVRGSVGSAFRAPNLYELYRTWQSWGTTYQSNPELKPETVWTYELSIDQYLFAKKTRLSLTGYRNDIDDLIYYRIEGSDKIRTNAGKGRTYGLELEASHRFTDWLTIWGNLTYIDAKITDNSTDPDSEDKRITGIPKTAYNIGIKSQYKWFKGDLIGRYFSKIYNDADNNDKDEGVYGTYEPAFLMDAKVTVGPWQNTEVSLSVDNIFDEEYYQYYQTDGRTFFCEISYKF